jgi:hypothetical protein
MPDRVAGNRHNEVIDCPGRDGGTRIVTAYSAAPGVLAQQLDDEVILLDTASGVYFRLNDSGAAAWDLIEQGRDLPGIVTELASRFGQPESVIQADISALLQDLESRGLVSARE